MIRLTMVLVALLSVLSPSIASLAPRKDRLHDVNALPQHLLRDGAAKEPKEDGPAINETTEVLLDGKVCKYGDVPADAEIVLLDVSPDKKVVKKIHFRSKK